MGLGLGRVSNGLRCINENAHSIKDVRLENITINKKFKVSL